MSRTDERKGRPNFGLDAPPIVYGYLALGLVGVGLLIVETTAVSSSVLLGWGRWALVLGFGVAAPMVYSSKIGKIRVRDRLLETLRLRGNEEVLDLGCGSGLMLLGAAGQTSAGSATGIDIAGSGSYVATAGKAGMRGPRRSGCVLGIFPPARIVTATKAAQGPPAA